jgi:hypothetical protein
VSRRLSAILLTGLAASMLASGCAGVKPWQREVHARDDMAWVTDAQEAQRMSHIFFSKEAALPGGGGGGGGCGCN